MANVERPKAILDFLQGSDTPLTAPQIAKEAFGLTSSKDIQAVTVLLEELSAGGKVFQYPPERVGSKIRFGRVKPADWLRAKILNIVQRGGGRLTMRQVRDSLCKWKKPYFDEAMGRLVTDRRLFYLTVNYKYVMSSPPEPYDYLLPRQITALRETLERINRHRKNALTIEDLRTFLNESSSEGIPSVQVSREPSRDLLLEWYQKDLPRRGGLASIPVPWTWSHYESWCISHNTKPDPAKFHDFLWHLHRAGEIEFIAHSMTQGLSDRESELSLKGPHGEVFFYWKWR